MSKLAIRLLLIVGVVAILYQGMSRVLALGGNGGTVNLARLLLYEVRRHEALQQRNKEVAEAEEVKLAASEEFIAGRLTLAEALKRFQEATKLIENDPEGLVAPYLVPETKAALCSQVLVWVESALRAKHTHQEAESVLCRFEEEQQELLQTEESDPYPDSSPRPSLRSN